MGVIMGKIIMRDTENQTQLILQAGEEESLKKQVEGIDMLERKAKAFDEILDIDLAQHDEEYADNVMKVVNKYMEEE